MSDKNTEQKYFVGNWIQNKENPKKIGLIHGIFEGPSELTEDAFYDIAFINPGDEIGFCPQDEILAHYDVIPFPWQLFFKVGDKVKILGTQKIGSITKVSTFAESIKPLYVKTVYMKGKECVDTYAPHELIKIGE